MPQSLAKVYIHLVFSTKHRAALIGDEIRVALHEYIGGILRQLECIAVITGSHVDHVHALFLLSRTFTIAKIVEEVKKGSSKWSKTQGNRFADFYWQSGYGAFSVSESNLSAVRNYVELQKEHHTRMTFQEEYRELLRKHNIEFDERYVWD